MWQLLPNNQSTGQGTNSFTLPACRGIFYCSENAWMKENRRVVVEIRGQGNAWSDLSLCRSRIFGSVSKPLIPTIFPRQLPIFPLDFMWRWICAYRNLSATSPLGLSSPLVMRIYASAFHNFGATIQVATKLFPAVHNTTVLRVISPSRL